MKNVDVTGGVRLKSLLESGRVYKGGQYLDTYNQIAFDNITGTIKARINSNCMYYVTVYEDV